MQNINEQLMDRVMSRVSFGSEPISNKFQESLNCNVDEVDGAIDSNDINWENVNGNETKTGNAEAFEVVRNKENRVGEIDNSDDENNELDGSEVKNQDSGQIHETRIEMFDNFGSDDSSNPFIIASFKSLNDEEDHTDTINGDVNNDINRDINHEDNVDNGDVDKNSYSDDDDKDDSVSDCDFNSKKDISDTENVNGGEQNHDAGGYSNLSTDQSSLSSEGDIKTLVDFIKVESNSYSRSGLNSTTCNESTNELYDVYIDNPEKSESSSPMKHFTVRSESVESEYDRSEDFKESDSTVRANVDFNREPKESAVGTKKSRKQNVPKRIIRDLEEYSVALETKCEKGKQYQNKIDGYPKQVKRKRTLDENSEKPDMQENNSSDSAIDDHNEEVNMFDLQETNIESNKSNSNSEYNTGDIWDSKNQSADETSRSSSYCFGTSQDLNLYSGMFSGHNIMTMNSSSSPNFALDENGPANLEVIRQLREIRCNRYRKIGMAEKREIAGYASAHGVSQAANFYNVSKSAVSMWTKLDFSQVDEKSYGQSKKNCMIGNEKFEALCQKVKDDRESKFKHLTKQDKFEVSRYAKLVGVREMGRCLDVALGTVSGWMRQFPYKVETKSTDDNYADETQHNTHATKSDTLDASVDNGVQSKTRKRKTCKSGVRKHKSNGDLEDIGDNFETVQEGDSMFIQSSAEGYLDVSPNTRCKLAADVDVDGNDSNIHQKDEIDLLIAENLHKPDTSRSFDEVTDLIKGTPLEGDDFFISLCQRVIACRADKYKTLKPSEKLEVVRYSKRVGVRRVAKILGLATGTLSGWTTKYQDSLGLTDPSIDNPVKPDSDLLVSYLTPNSGEAKTDSTDNADPSTDSVEKPEVTAVKLLFKENYPVMLKKIEVAKQIKFRNISKDEKVEFVKCSKLVGIRPTARVFGIPIGTLSGWITKYTRLLHPAYQVDGDVNAAGHNSDISFDSSQLEMSHPLVVGKKPDLNLGLPIQVSSPNFTNITASEQSVTDTYSQLYFNSMFRINTENQSEKEEKFGTSLIKEHQADPIGTKNFDEEAKLMAERFLKSHLPK